jgi:hypothetical protein
MPGMSRVLRMYGQPSDHPPLDWGWAAEQLETAGLYCGPISRLAPVTVMSWRTAGWAGRESFQQTGSWPFQLP